MKPAAGVVILLLVLFAACRGPDTDATAGADRGVPVEVPPEPEGEKVGAFEGHYLSGFEISSFSPCAFPGQRWWVGENLEPVEEFIRASGRDPIRQQTTVHVKWSGRASPLGRYGHMGGYQRDFTIEKVHEIRAARQSDCPPPED